MSNPLWKHIERLCGAQEPSWSMRELARRCGISVSKLSRFKNGLTDLALEDLERIAAQFAKRGGDLWIEAGSTAGEICEKSAPRHISLDIDVFITDRGKVISSINRTEVR